MDFADVPACRRGWGADLDGEDGGEGDGGEEGEPGEEELSALDAAAGRDEPLMHDVGADDDEEAAVVEVGQELHERKGQHEDEELHGGDRGALRSRPHAAADRQQALAEDVAACSSTLLIGQTSRQVEQGGWACQERAEMGAWADTGGSRVATSFDGHEPCGGGDTKCPCS